MSGTLEPRKYRIKQDHNEYVYLIEWFITSDGPKWAIVLNGFLMTSKFGFDYPAECGGKDTLYFDTPEEALELWNEYILKKDEEEKQRKADQEASVAAYLQEVFQTLKGQNG